MGFLKWKSKPKGLFEEEASQRSNSETLPRKAVFEGGDDGRDSFLIKAAVAPTPRSNSLVLPPGGPAGLLKTAYRSASVVVAPSGRLAAGAAGAAGSAGHSAPAPLLPEYKAAAQFSHKQELYKGSISTVYKAQCALTKTDVIIKQYIKHKMSSRSTHKMQREVRLMRMLRSQEGVATILGDFQDEAFYYIIMEHCAGGDLYHRMILNGEFDEHWACKKVIIPLLCVLDYIHTEAHIVHRDIKPENLFLTMADELRLGDFGLAIKSNEELPFLRAGTLDYMAPEVLVNRAVDDFDERPGLTAADIQAVGLRVYDEKVDVWAVGVLAYELVVGEAPFYHQDEKETVRLIKESNAIPFPARMRLSLWADFVRAALKKDPRQRPSAGDLLRHPWVQQHSSPPLLFSNLLQPALGSGPVARTASLPATQAALGPGYYQQQQHKAAGQLAASASHPQLASGQGKPLAQSLQIVVDATGAGAPAAAAPASASPAADHGGTAAVSPPLQHPSSAGCRDGRGSALGRASRCEGLVRDDLRVTKRASLLDLRRTRSTGEANVAAPAHRASLVHGSSDSGASGASEPAASNDHSAAAAAEAAGVALVAAGGHVGTPDALDSLMAAADGVGAGAEATAAAAATEEGAARGISHDDEDQEGLEAAVETCEQEDRGGQRGMEEDLRPPLLQPLHEEAACRPASRRSLRRSELAGGGADALDAFAAETAHSRSGGGHAQHRHQQQQGEAGDAPAPSGGSPTASTLQLQPAAAANAHGHSPAMRAHLSPAPLLPGVPQAASIASRPKSHSMPKSTFTSKLSFLGGSSSNSSSGKAAEASGAGDGAAVDSNNSSGGSSGAHSSSSSSSSASRMLAGWGRKPSRLSVATSSHPAPHAAAQGAGSPGAGAVAPEAAGGWLPKSPVGRAGLGMTLTGSSSGSFTGTQDGGANNGGKSGSINRLKLYLSRQRG